MSWLNFNEGLNLGNLKGQLTTLAGNVLQNINDGTASVVSNLMEDEHSQSTTENNTQYEFPEAIAEEEIVKVASDSSNEKFTHLKKIIRNLEQEKSDYLQTMKQLDTEYQENILELSNSKKELEIKYKDLISRLEMQNSKLDSLQFELDNESQLRKKFEEKYNEKLIENQQLVSEMNNLKAEMNSVRTELSVIQEKTASDDTSQIAEVSPMVSCENCTKLVVQVDNCTQINEALLSKKLQSALSQTDETSYKLAHNESDKSMFSSRSSEKTDLIEEIEDHISKLLKLTQQLNTDLENQDNIDQVISKLKKENICQLQMLLKNMFNNTSTETENILTKQQATILVDLENENDLLKSKIEQLENDNKSYISQLRKTVDEYEQKLEYSSSTCERLQSELNIVKDELYIAIETQKQLQTYIEQVEDKYQRSKLEETALKLQNDHLRNELNTATDKKQYMTKEIVKCVQSFTENMCEHIENLLQNNEFGNQNNIQSIMKNFEDSSYNEENIENPVLFIEKRLEIFARYVNTILKSIEDLNNNFRSIKEDNHNLEANLMKILQFAHSNKITEKLPDSSDATLRDEVIENLCQKIGTCFQEHISSENVVHEVEHLKDEEEKLKKQYESLSTKLSEEQTKNKGFLEEKIKISDCVRKNVIQSIEIIKQFGIFEAQNEFKDILKSCEDESSNGETYDNSFEFVEKQISVSSRLFHIVLAYLKNIWFAYDNLIKEKDNLGRNIGCILETATKLSLIERPHEISEVRPLDDLVKDICEKLKVIVTKSKESTETSDEVKKLKNENDQLREKCTSLSSNLLQEQSNNQHLTSERNNLLEQEAALTKKLERLQTHLIEVEEHYTKELVEAEEKVSSLQQKLREIEQSERNSSNLYKSINIRANQKLETLQSQSQLLVKERDDLKKKLIEAEIRNEENIAALKNLHNVLEQFQNEKDLEIKLASDRIRKETAAEKIVQEELKREIQALKEQLEQSKQGLYAASRLSSQLESSQHQVSLLKDELAELRQRLADTEKLNSAPSKKAEVEKTLLKNLIISAFSYNKEINENQTQIIRIIGHVLDFTEEDNKRLSQKESQSTWSKLFSSSMRNQDHETLTQQFVKFLESESAPRDVLSFSEVPEHGKSTNENKIQSSSILSDISLPTFGNFAEIRSSSSILKDVLKDNH